MRVLHMGDAHVGKLIRGRSRLAEHEAVLRGVISSIEQHQPHVLVLPGDTFDGAHPGPDEIALIGNLISRAVAAGAEVIITSGNHDGPTTLRDLNNKVTAWIGSFAIPHVHAHSGPEFEQITLRDGEVVSFYTLPYPHKRSFDNQLDKSLQGRTEEVSKALENIIETTVEVFQREHPGEALYFAGHMSTLNVELSADQAMKMGWDVTPRAETFDPFAMAFLGHIHRAQIVAEHAAYSGSLLYGDFGETTQTKSYALWDDDDRGHGTLLKTIPADPWPMMKLVGKQSEGWELPELDREFTGWLLIQLDPDQGGRPSYEFKRSLKREWPNAAGVWVDVLAPPKKARIRLAQGVEHAAKGDIVQAYLEAKGMPIEPTLTRARELMAAVDGD